MYVCNNSLSFRYSNVVGVCSIMVDLIRDIWSTRRKAYIEKMLLVSQWKFPHLSIEEKTNEEFLEMPAMAVLYLDSSERKAIKGMWK